MRLLLGGLVCFVALSTNCFAQNVKVGVAGPITGGLAAFGEQIQHGAEIAAEDINKQGGLLGKQITVVSGDDGCDPKQARSVANKMVGEKTSVVFGHWCAGPSMAASSVYNEENILQIDVGGLLNNYTHQGFVGAFRVSTSSRTYAEVIARYIEKNNPKANVAIVTDQPAVTKELSNDLQALLATTGNKVVAIEDIRGGDKDFSTVIDKLKTAQPQVVICSCYTVEAGLLARQMADKKLDVYYYGWDTLNSPDFLKIIGDADTKKIVAIDYARAPQNPVLEKLATTLQAKGWPVETTTILTYAAFQAYADAVKSANSFETAKVAKILREKKFSTVLGDLKFDQYGERVKPAFATYQWIDGKLKVTGAVAY